MQVVLIIHQNVRRNRLEKGLFSDPKHKKYLEFLGLGLEIAVALAAPILFGYWLDIQWETSPWMLFAGIILGFVLMAGIFSRVIRKMNNER